MVVTLAGQDRRQTWPNEKQTPTPQYCLFFPVAFFVLKEKKRRSPKIDSGLACQWLLKPFFFFFSTHSSHASSLAGGEERAGGKTELVTDKMMRGGSLSCVFGERIAVSLDWTIPGA